MENIEQERNSKLKLTILLVYILLLGLLTGISSGSDVKLNFEDAGFINMMKILQAVFVVFLFILPAVLIATLWTKPKLSYLGITTRPAATTLFIAATGMILASPLINWLAEMNSHMQLPASLSGVEEWMKKSEAEATMLTEAFTKGTSFGTLILNLFVIAFMAALSEEIFFRGLLQKVLMECVKNKHIAIWIGAAIFSAFHMQFYGFVPRMMMGAFLGYLYMWSGSLWPGIIAHFVNNAMAVFLVWLSNRGTISVDADKIGIEGNEWIYVLMSVIMVVSSLVLVYKSEKKRKELTELSN